MASIERTSPRQAAFDDRTPSAAKPRAGARPAPRRVAHAAPARPILAGVVVLILSLYLTLHWPVWGYPFLLDDFAFYDDAGRTTAATLLLGSPSNSNYYRPLGREIYFALGRALFGPNPDAFRVVNLALLLATTIGVMALAARWGGARAAALAGVAYASFGFHRVTLGWISGGQDLLAAAFGMLATNLYLSGRSLPAAASLFVGLFAKGSIAALPLVLTAFARVTRSPVRRTLPLWIACAAWLLIVVVVRTLHDRWTPTESGAGIADLVFTPAHALEGVRLAMLSYAGLSQSWSELALAWTRYRPSPLALAIVAAIVALAWLLPARTRPEKGPRSRDTGAREGSRFALLWAVLGVLPIAFVGHHFSGYYVTFAAVGVAVGLGLALARAHVVVSVGALWILLVVHAVALDTRDYRISLEDPGPRGTPFVSASRLEASAKLVGAYEHALRSAVRERGTEVVLYRMTRELSIATAEDRGPRVWLDDPTLTLVSQSQHPFSSVPDGRPRVFLRLDDERESFAELPESLAVAMHQGEAAMERGDMALARTRLAHALAWARPGEHDIERAELSNTIGVAAGLQGDAPTARRAWEATLAVDPDHENARINLALADASDGRVDAARARLLALLAQHPENERARSVLARIEQAVHAPAP